MYSMKSIITHDLEIPLPKCMYLHKKLHESIQYENLGIDNQVTKLYKKSCNRFNDLNIKQDQLLKKIEMLYDRIKDISSLSSSNNKTASEKPRESDKNILAPSEIVLTSNPEMLPWFLCFLSTSLEIHVHSSVPKNQIKKVENFMKCQQTKKQQSNINLKVIITCGDPELRLTALTTPIVGNVNILRYLSFLYPNQLNYDENNYVVDQLLDLCHTLERAKDQSKIHIWEKITLLSKKFVYGDNFTIVDVAAYNIIKNLLNRPQYVSKDWYERCEKLCAN